MYTMNQPRWYKLSPCLVTSLMREKNHERMSLHYTHNTIQYLYFLAIYYHSIVCKHGLEGSSSTWFYTRTWNKDCLLQDSSRKTVKSIFTSHSSTHQFIVLPDNLSFTKEMKALSTAIFPIQECPQWLTLRSDAWRVKGKNDFIAEVWVHKLHTGLEHTM